MLEGEAFESAEAQFDQIEDEKIPVTINLNWYRENNNYELDARILFIYQYFNLL